MTEQERVDRAKVIFVGVVRSVEESREVDPLYPLVVQFEVTEVHKGQVPSQLSVNTGRHSAACGYYFSEGGRYLVFAWDHESRLTTGLCSGNRDLAQASDPFGTGRPPLSASPSLAVPRVPPAQNTWAGPIIVVAAALLALVLIPTAWLVHRTRTRRRTAAPGT